MQLGVFFGYLYVLKVINLYIFKLLLMAVSVTSDALIYAMDIIVMSPP